MNPIFEIYNIFYFDKELKLPKGLALYSDGSLYKTRRSFRKDLSNNEKSIQNEILILRSEKIAQRVQTILHHHEKAIKVLPTVMIPSFHIIDGQEEFIRLGNKVIYGLNALCFLSYSGNNLYQQLIKNDCDESVEPFLTFTKILQEIQDVIGDFGQYLFTGKRIQTICSIDNKEILKLHLSKYNYFKGYPLFDSEANEGKIIFSLGKNYESENRIIFEGNPFCCKLPLDNHKSYITENMISLYIGFDKNGIVWCDTAFPEEDRNNNYDFIFFAAEKIIFEKDEE